jgi:flagellar basal-body rod protein FlgC
MPISAIDAIGAAASGINASLQDLAASAHNVANIRTAKPTDGPAFQGEQVIHTEEPGGGVSTTVAPQGTEEGVVLSEPDHPDADEAGLVRYPNIDIAAEMVNVVVAQRAIEANVATIHRAVDTYRDMKAMTASDRAQMAASANG